MERDQAMKFIYDLLRAMVAKKSSDLFIRVGLNPCTETIRPARLQPLL